MKSKLSDLSIIGVGESNLLVVHLDDVVLTLFPFNEGSDPDDNFDVVGHGGEAEENI